MIRMSAAPPQAKPQTGQPATTKKAVNAAGAKQRAGRIADVRRWRRQYPDWRDTRSQIEKNYGYDKYPGNCHVVPNHAIMIMAVLYAPDDFARAQTIVCTSGWDTDCNAGNVGCLIGAMLGLAGIDAGPDWRGPVADRMLLSSADGGGAIYDAVRITYVAGYGNDASALPVNIRHAAKMLVGLFYNNREGGMDTKATGFGFALDALLQQHRIPGF